MNEVASRRCSKCRKPKTPSEMVGTRGQGAYCYPCNRELRRARYKKDPDYHRKAQRDWQKANKPKVKAMHLRWRYGIKQEVYEALLQKQNGVCAICKGLPAKRMLDVDHDHNTGTVRGLLCSNCNTALGLLKDNPELLEVAKMYLLAYGDRRGV
jgi:hypothetical protein